MRRKTLLSNCKALCLLRYTLLCFAILLSASMNAQSMSSHKIGGQITSATDGQPLIGVSVLQKGTTNGTITDIDGNFELAVPAGSTLIVSYVGFNTQEIAVTPNKTHYPILLKEDAQILDEVVVVGYGVQKKKLITGATVQVKGDDILKQNTVSPLSAIQGQSPGVTIMKKSGQPGEGFKVNIRGIGTVGNSQPLYIVDGVARDNIDYLSPSDIESLDVLKDAASAAIYGARAANGVVLVTTKQGKAGKALIEYNGYYGIQNVYKRAPLLDAQQYATIMNEAQVNSGLKEYAFDTLLAPGDWDRIQKGTWKGTNWLKAMENEDAPIQSHALNIAGGTELSIYSIGLSFSSQEGIYGKPVEPEYSRYTARVNTEHTLYKANNLDVIKFGENLSYSYTEKNGIGIGDNFWNDISNALRAAPFLPLWARDANGNDIVGQYHYALPWNNREPNPVGVMDYTRGQNMSKNHNINGNFYFVIQPIKDLTYRSSFGVNVNAYSYRAYTPKYKLGPETFSDEDYVSQNSGNSISWTFENTLSYKFKIKESHSFDALIGTSAERWGLGEGLSAGNANSLFNDFNHAYLDNAKVINTSKTTVGGAPMGKGGILSYFGRINYNYQEKYMVTVVMRADGSSNFAKGNRWGYFPSISAGWVMTNEKFMEPVTHWMDFMKLRASWGQNGNQSISPFQYLSTISFDGAYFFQGDDKNKIQLGGYPDILPNPDVTWETSEQLDLGFDARFLAGRLGVAFDWYKKTTKDWLIQAPILGSYGTGAPYINGGNIENKGIELGLDWKDKLGNFTYSVGANIAYNKNEVTRIANNEGIIRSGVKVGYNASTFPRAEVGQPIGYFWGYKTDGIFQNEQEVQNYKNSKGEVILPTAVPGDIRFVDINDDGIIDDRDKTNIGDPNPDVNFGFNFSLGYKGFDLSVNTSGVLGNQIYKQYRGDNSQNNYTTEVLGRWHGEGTSNKIPRVTSGAHINEIYVSDRYVENGDYWRINNLTLGYDFKKLFPKVPLQQMRLYFTAQNLYTFTGYSGMDPEIGTSTNDGESAWVSGVDVGFYPLPRTYMFGLNLKF